MPNDTVITVRIPSELKRRLRIAAQANRRSLSAQIGRYLEVAAGEVNVTSSQKKPAKSFRGRFAGTKLPTDQDLEEVRRRLWGKLPRKVENGRS